MRVRVASATPTGMKEFLNQNKIFIGVVLGTLILLFGGVFLFSRNGSGSPGAKVSSVLLEPAGKQKTGGIVNGSYIVAPADAKVSLIEFGDYECPACGAYNPLVKQVLTQFSGKVTFGFKNFPLSQHANAPISSYAAEAAGLQGKFWQMHDKLYENQDAWSTSSDARNIFVGYAKDLGLDVARFTSDIDSQKVKDIVSSDLNDGNTVGINATPTFFVNGVKIDNPLNFDAFSKIIQNALDKSPITESSGEAAYHIHFDLKVYLNGSPVDFTLARYQDSKTNVLDENIHFHDGNGKVVHIHKTGIALSELFSSLKITLPSNVLAFVNGRKVDNILDYVPQDLDQILIGSSNLSSVSKDACIYSLKCPERGTPPPEDCVGGLGTGCTD